MDLLTYETDILQIRWCCIKFNWFGVKSAVRRSTIAVQEVFSLEIPSHSASEL